MLRDIDIRSSLLTRIEKQNDGKDYRIINEMAVCDGSARVDIAVANGKLVGYEIKSDMDNLDRLAMQSRYYNNYDVVI